MTGGVGALTLEGHDETTLALDHLGDHVVNETVLVPDLLGIELGLVVLLIDLLEDVLEAAIVLLQDGVLGAHVQRQTLQQGQLEAGVGETGDRLIRVVLSLGNAAAALEVEDLDGLRLTASRGVDHLQLAGAGDHTVLGTVLVSESVTTDDDGLAPARYQPGDAGDDNGLTENSSAASTCVSMKPRENGRNGAAYRMFRMVPLGESHTARETVSSRNPIAPTRPVRLTLLQLELLHTGLIWGNGGALDTNAILLDGLGSLNGDLVVGLVTVLQTLKEESIQHAC